MTSDTDAAIRGGQAVFNPNRIIGALFVIVLHAATLYGLWSHRLIPSPAEAATLFVNFIAPPEQPKAEVPKRPPDQPKPRPVEKPRPQQLVAETPAVATTEYVAPPPPPRPAPVIEAPATALPNEPVVLSAELSVACPERVAPTYPTTSRRLRETGEVVLSVELSESGHVAAATVKSSSGHPRLDEAALAAVRTWRCNPATRHGQPVRAMALQPFNFILRGN